MAMALAPTLFVACTSTRPYLAFGLQAGARRKGPKEPQGGRLEGQGPRIRGSRGLQLQGQKGAPRGGATMA
eukprot:4741468-Pyramimonas_sp.AAC.1